MTEIWRDIKGFEGLYQISNQGRVKSLKFGNERILKPARDKDGYLFVILYKDGVRKHFRVHRLVAEAFVPNPEHKPEVDHINTIRDDNRAENLRWATGKENQNNPLSIEKQKGEKSHMYGKFGAEHPNSKPVIGVNKLTDEEVRFACAMEVQRVLGINQGNISNCLRGRQKSAGGFYWYYQEF